MTSPLETLLPSVDAAAASEHLSLLHAGATGFVSLVVMRARHVNWAFSEASLAQQATVPLGAGTAALQDVVDDRWNVYTACAAFHEVPERGRGCTNDVGSVPGAWADIDVKPGLEGCFQTEAEALAYLARIPLPPTLVVGSGSGGRHAYWLLHPDLRADLRSGRWLLQCWRDLLLEKAGGIEVDAVQDPARVLRLAGTVRWPKAEEQGGMPRPVELLVSDGPRYNLDELLVEARPAFEAAQAARVAARDRANAEHERWSSALGRYSEATIASYHRLIETFNQYQDWAALLEPTGWTLFADERGRFANCRYWTRPDKSVRDGKSAATDYTDETGKTSSLLTLYSEDPALADLVEYTSAMGRRVCTKYHYALVRLFNGDEGALHQEIRNGGGILS